MGKLKKKQADGSKLVFNGAVYGSEDIRSRLEILQNGKCAYCEVNIQPVSVGHVEHFRPKGEVFDEEASQMLRPGYYWLAYDWENLMLSCPSCNQSFKKSRFPLTSEADRWRVPSGQADTASTLLIDPFLEDPRQHIRFRQDVPVPVDGSVRGETTIEVLGLDRGDLNSARRARIQIINLLQAWVERHPTDVKAEETRELIREFRANDGEFHSCILDCFGPLD